MTGFRSRSLKTKQRHSRILQAAAQQAGSTAVTVTAPAPPVIMEWCAEHYDKEGPVAPAPKVPFLSWIQERPYAAGFVLLNLFGLVMLLAGGNAQYLLKSHQASAMMWLTLAMTGAMLYFCGTPLGDVVFYRIDLHAEQIVLHRKVCARRTRIVWLSFDAITTVLPYQDKYYSTTCGIDIDYLDDRLKGHKVRVPSDVPERLARAHMETLRRILGVKVEAEVTHDY